MKTSSKQISFIVTGAAGFIGWHLVKTLSSNKNYIIYAVDNLLKNTDNSSFYDLVRDNENVVHLNVDLTNLNDTLKLPAVDYLYHFAAINGTQNFYNYPFDVVFNSTCSTLNILKYCFNSPPLRFIFAGTSESYAGCEKYKILQIPTPESTPLVIDDIKNVRWSYASSKINGESAVVSASEQFKFDYTIIRFHNIYGPRMGVNHVIPDYLQRISKGNSSLYGYQNTRSFLYIDDAVNDVIGVTFSDNFKNEIVNIGSSQEISMEHLAHTINELLDFKGELIKHDAPLGSVKRRVPLLNFVDSVLGNNRKRTSLNEGLTRTISYYLKNE